MVVRTSWNILEGSFEGGILPNFKSWCSWFLKPATKRHHLSLPFHQKMHQLDRNPSSHVPVETHHLPTGRRLSYLSFFFFYSPPLATFHWDFFVHPVAASSVIPALSRPRPDSAAGLKGATERNVKLRQKDLIWKRRNAFHIRSQKT